MAKKDIAVKYSKLDMGATGPAVKDKINPLISDDSVFTLTLKIEAKILLKNQQETVK